MSSEVRNRIASYEAQNKEVRRPSHSSGGSPAHHKRQDQAGGMEMSSGNGSTSTALAAQNRVSRMRQEQLTRDGKSHQSNLVEKRKLLKERRILQQKRTPASEVHVGPDNATTDAASIPQSVDPPRRSGASEETDKDAALHSSSPGRSGTSRLAKMHRMQKMKGYDPPKRTAKVNASVPAKPSMAASSTASTATTAVAHNSANKLQRRQRQTTLMQTLAKRASVVSQRATPAMPDNGASPQPTSRSFSHLSAASPKSDIDALSDNNYAYVATDQSVEPTTDDEATLTSVRRIMTRENVDDSTPREKSHHYHHLQAQSSRGDDSIHASHRSGRTTTTPAFSQGTVQNKRAGKSSTTNTRSRLEKRRNWPHEEKSDKGSIPDVFRAASSSDYDTDGDVSKCSRQSNALDGPTQSQATDVNDFFAKSRYAQTNRRVDDDERTFDYGDKDDDSNGSTSFAMRQRRGAEQASPEEGPSNEWKEPKPPAGPSSLINKEDVEHYTKSMGSPALKIGAGVIGAFTVGCIVLGPAGLLAGAACIGLGVGVMQIPEEERHKIQAKVHQTVSKVHEQAVDATEKLSNSCAATYEESGVAEHLPPCLSLPVAENAGSKDHDSAPSEKRVARATAEESTSGPKAAPVVAAAPPPLLHEINNKKSEQGNNMDRLRNKKVACLRKARILPPAQIHGLDPSAQPKAWLDVVASANTSEDEKAEAMEEILILAKDKRRARIFLEEGILDSLIWTLDRYLEKVHGEGRDLANTTVSTNEFRVVKLASTCLVQLGKSHCAAIHTEGDLQLMSLYERGSVPEERQVAQMLYEIPHHVRVTKVADPTIVDPSKEVFALRQLSLEQALDLARSAKAVLDGQP